MAKIVTITNPLTGQPTQVDQLEHTAQQIDDGLNIARGVSNPNLLDNWYFGNPIDQRGGYVVPPNTPWFTDLSFSTVGGKTNGYYVYTPYNSDCGSIQIGDVTGYVAVNYAVRGYTGAGYGIDRWRCEIGTTLLILDGRIRLSGEYQISQFFENAINGTVTASVLFENRAGNAFKIFTNNGTALIERASTSDSSGLLAVTFDAAGFTELLIGFRAISATDTVDIKAIKLELGSQQTLAHQDSSGNWVLNEIPDYGEQLRRCQRYARWMDGCYSGYIDNVNNIQLSVPEIKDMRTLPTISNIQWDRFVAIPYGDGGAFNISSDYETAITYNGLRIGNTGLNISRYLPVATVFNLRAFLSADL